MSIAFATRLAPVLAGVLCLSLTAACSKNRRSGRSSMAQWVEDPSPGTREGDTITIEPLQVKFEIPDTLYVFRECQEADHAPEGDWVPVITCSSTSGDVFSADDGDDALFADDDGNDSQAEPIALRIFATPKTRPIDERAVAWFENQYKQSGLDIEDISYQNDFQKKRGIYAKLHVVDPDTGAPSREIVQFMFPRKDVVFIARMEYPFGETRSVEADWRYILWNFDFVAPPVEEDG